MTRPNSFSVGSCFLSAFTVFTEAVLSLQTGLLSNDLKNGVQVKQITSKEAFNANYFKGENFLQLVGLTIGLTTG